MLVDYQAEEAIGNLVNSPHLVFSHILLHLEKYLPQTLGSRITSDFRNIVPNDGHSL